MSRSGSDWGARIDEGLLQFTNDATGTANANGWAFGYVDSDTTFSAPWSSTLSSNSIPITWIFNMRNPRNDPAGFGVGSYGCAFILVTNTSTPNNTGVGYAIVHGQSGTFDPIRLVKFSAGTQTTGSLVNIISGSTDLDNEYLSIQVTYNPANNEWQLFVRDDGGSTFTDPRTGIFVNYGTATDSTYTSTPNLKYMGGWWQGSTAANQVAVFNDVYVILGICPPTPTPTPTPI